MSSVFDNYDFDGWQTINKDLLEKENATRVSPVMDQLGFLVQWKNYERASKPQLHALMLKQFPELKNADKSFKPVLDEITGTNIFEYFKYMYAILLWSEAGQHPTDECPDVYEFGKRQELYTPYEPVSPDHLSDWMTAYPRDEWEKLCKDENEKRAQKDAYCLDIYHGYVNVVQDELIKQFPQILNINQDWWYVYKFITIREAWRWKDKLEQIEFFVTNGLSAEWMQHSAEDAKKEISRRNKAEKQNR
jgi:hypothetical protein